MASFGGDSEKGQQIQIKETQNRMLVGEQSSEDLCKSLNPLSIWDSENSEVGVTVSMFVLS